MSAMDRCPIPQLIFWLPLVAIPSSNVLRGKALRIGTGVSLLSRERFLYI